MTLDFSFESAFGQVIAGIDEAGRGPWAGPVVAACVILDRASPIVGINDSKQLNKARREALYSRIKETAKVGIGIASVAEIDTLNILVATKLAMQRSFTTLNAASDIILIDGNQLPALAHPMKAIVRGDALSISIAAASIIAKVTRDRIMAELALDFPHYGWEKNAGYGTQLHRQGITQCGITAHHRRSFSPIKKHLEEYYV